MVEGIIKTILKIISSFFTKKRGKKVKEKRKKVVEKAKKVVHEKKPKLSYNSQKKKKKKITPEKIIDILFKEWYEHDHTGKEGSVIKFVNTIHPEYWKKFGTDVGLGIQKTWEKARKLGKKDIEKAKQYFKESLFSQVNMNAKKLILFAGGKGFHEHHHKNMTTLEYVIHYADAKELLRQILWTDRKVIKELYKKYNITDDEVKEFLLYLANH